MKKIYNNNSKERIPTILPGDLAEAWMFKELTIDEAMDIANYQVSSAEMKATLLHQDFLKRENPHEECFHPAVSALVYT